MVGLLLLSSVLTSSLSGCGSNAPDHGVDVSSGMQASGARLQENQEKIFPLMATPPEGIPGYLRRVIGKPAYGISWDSAQRIHGLVVSAWLLPGRRTVCLLVQPDFSGVSQTCARLWTARAHGLIMSSVSAGPSSGVRRFKRLTIGIAPYKRRHIVLHTGSQTTRLRALPNGAFEYADYSSSPGVPRLTLRSVH